MLLEFILLKKLLEKNAPDEDSYIIHSKNLDVSDIEDYEEDETNEETNEEYYNRISRESFDLMIQSGKNKVSITTNNYTYNHELLRQLLEDVGLKVTFTGRSGYTMEKR